MTRFFLGVGLMVFAACLIALGFWIPGLPGLPFCVAGGSIGGIGVGLALRHAP